MSEPTDAQKANLARIRDNQRRSRARRREYLQELETKYRTCEAVGVEASAELQAAARRVLDENRRLRILLKQKGVTDAEIDGVSVGSPGPEELSDSSQTPTAAGTLNRMLRTRRPCKPGSECGSATSPVGSLRTSATPVAPVPKPTQITTPTRASMPSQQPQLTADIKHPSPYLTPQVSTPTGAPFSHTPTPQYDMYAQAPYQYSVQGHNITQWQPAPELPPQPLTQQHMSPAMAAQSQPMQYPDKSSCYVAADVIRSLNPNAGREVETALGCADGRECAIDNAVVFDLMDRYAPSAML